MAELNWVQQSNDIEQAVEVRFDDRLSPDLCWHAILYTKGFAIHTMGQYFETEEKAQVYADQLLKGIIEDSHEG
jgi:hypothetical protein